MNKSDEWLCALLARTASRLVLIGLITTVTFAQSKDDRTIAEPKPALGQVSGHVYRADTGEPIPKTQVLLLPADEATAKAADQRTARTGPDGAFTFTDLPGGNYEIETWRNGYSAALDPDSGDRELTNRKVALKPGQTIENIVLHLYPAGVISGQVLDEDQDPVPGLPVFALHIDFKRGGQRNILLAAQTITDDLGNYRIPNLRPGSYLVRAGGLMEHPMQIMQEMSLKEGPAGRVQYQNTFYPGTSSLSEAQAVHVSPLSEARDTRFTVPAETTFTVRGKVLTGAALPPKGSVEVECRSPDDIGYNFSMAPSTVVDPNGSFKISGLPPGDYTLTAIATDQGVTSHLGFASVHISDADVHTDVEVGHAAEVYGKVEAPLGVPLRGKRIQLVIFGPGFYLLHQSSELDPTGRFDIKNIPPGVFTFSLSASDEDVYVKKAVCGGHDYAAREFTLTAESRLDCDVTLAHDTSSLHGKVTSSGNPVAGAVVVMIPASPELRKVLRYTLTSKTDAAGQYKLAAVIPSDYLLFAVPSSSDHAYFDPAFVERNTLNTESVTVSPGRAQTVDLKLSASQ
jgi:hypothetical protein